MPTKPQKITVLGGGLIFFAGLLFFAYLGIFNRYYADDWCYNADLLNLGLVGTLKGYTYITTYASNRFSLTLFSGLFYYLGIFGVQMMTPLTIITWLAGIYCNLHNLNKITKSRFPVRVILFIAIAILYYALYLAPHPYQNLYWRSGLLPYTAPLIMSTWIFGLITWQIRMGNPSRLWVLLVGLLAFLAGGFSEAGCAFLAAALGLYVLAAIFGKTKKSAWAEKTLPMASIALFLVLTAMVFLILSPANDSRMLASYGEPTPLLELPMLVLTLGFDFVDYFIHDLPIPTAIIFVTFALLAFILRLTERYSFKVQDMAKWILIITGIAFLLIAASQAPSAYVEGNPPAPRAQIIPRFIIILLLTSLAWLSGYFMRQHITWKWANFLAIFMLLFCYAYAVRSIILTSERLEIYTQRATIWDQRDFNILQAKEQGDLEVNVRGIDSLPVGEMKDLQPNGKDWVNRCAARYYGLDAIHAVLP